MFFQSLRKQKAGLNITGILSILPNNMENLFSYGTLQKESVQLTTFHRVLKGEPDLIVGYKLSMIEITDPGALATSGESHHPILRYTGKVSDMVRGTVFKITSKELEQADEYEVSDYKRVAVPLRSGGKAWVYVAANAL